MPFRRTPLVTGEIYHIFNRSIARVPIFTQTTDYQRFLQTIDFYRFLDTPIRFSHLNRLPLKKQREMLDAIYTSGTEQIELYALCIMPNHVHFLLKQIKDDGIRTFMSNLQNSYAKYFNTKTKRTGTVFENMFKGIRIEIDEQFVHVARYIHLNPVTSYILTEPKQLLSYPWSSFTAYAEASEMPFVQKDMLLGFFSSKEDLIDFTFDQANYQRELHKIKHLAFD